MAEKTEENLNIDCNSLRALSSADKPYKLLTELQSERILLSKEESNASEVVTELFDKITKDSKHERQATLNFLREVLAIYKGRFAFQKKGDR